MATEKLPNGVWQKNTTLFPGIVLEWLDLHVDVNGQTAAQRQATKARTMTVRPVSAPYNRKLSLAEWHAVAKMIGELDESKRATFTQLVKAATTVTAAPEPGEADPLA